VPRLHPFIKAIWKGKGKLYKDLEEKYKDSPVNFDRKKVQEFLSQNPEYFKQYKTKAYEQAYHDISAPDLSKSREKMREELKAEVMEEMKNNKQAGNIGLMISKQQHQEKQKNMMVIEWKMILNIADK